jgi:hypothetical protein
VATAKLSLVKEKEFELFVVGGSIVVDPVKYFFVMGVKVPKVVEGSDLKACISSIPGLLLDLK